MFAKISAISCLFPLLFVIFRCFFAKIYVIFGIFCYFLRKSALYPGSQDPPFLQRFSLLTLSYSYGASSLLCKYVLFSSVCPFVWHNGKQYQTSVAIAAEFLPTSPFDFKEQAIVDVANVIIPSQYSSDKENVFVASYSSVGYHACR